MPNHPRPVNLKDWLSHLVKLHPKSIALGLDRVQQVSQRMGLTPDFPVITVAGTNGKGSSCAILERILTEAGYHVGCYTSPHLLRYNERVRINCSELNDSRLCLAFSAVEDARADIALTYFEFGTLAAMRLFVDAGVDVAILEIGLGGRLDAVNIFEPDCAIITSIDLDHIDYLGNSLTSIGREKAGIFRSGRPALCGDANPPDSVPQTAIAIAADYRQIGVDFGYQRHDNNWTFWSNNLRIEALPLPALAGNFQLNNASCVLEALQHLSSQLPVTKDQIQAGLIKVNLRGRFERLCDQPQIIVDVAHNPHAARSLAYMLQQEKMAGGRTIAIFAMLSDKDIAGVVDAMHAEIDQWLLAGIDQVRGATAIQLAEIVNDHADSNKVSIHNQVSDALKFACRSANENDRIIAFGSFYTVADVIRALSINGVS